MAQAYTRYEMKFRIFPDLDIFRQLEYRLLITHKVTIRFVVFTITLRTRADTNVICL